MYMHVCNVSSTNYTHRNVRSLYCTNRKRSFPSEMAVVKSSISERLMTIGNIRIKTLRTLHLICPLCSNNSDHTTNNAFLVILSMRVTRHSNSAPLSLLDCQVQTWNFFKYSPIFANFLIVFVIRTK